MSDSTTTNYGWAYPTVNADANTWGTTLNSAIIAIDAQMHTNAVAACQAANNLSDLASASTARTNLGLGAAATQALSAFLQPANNLADVSSTATARGNLGLGSAAIQNSATFLQAANNLADVTNAATARSNLGVAAFGGDSSYAFRSNNLSDLGSASSARANLGLGSIATRNYSSGTGAPSGGGSGDLYGQHS